MPLFEKKAVGAYRAAPSIIEKAKKKAKREGKTLSHRIEEFLITYTASNKRKPSDQQLGA